MVDRYEGFAKVAEVITVIPLYSSTLKMLEEYKPDIVVGNNALLIPVLDKCRKKKDFKYIVTVTDIITVCRWWASPVADIVFVPTKEAEDTLKSFIPSANIVSGFFSFREILPLSDEKYKDAYDYFFSNTKFTPEKPIILITGGGYSTRKILQNMQSILSLPSYQFVILTGKDEKLREELRRELEGKENILVLGFTDRNLELMAISDLIISKFGSVSVVELEKLNKKTRFTKPVGYQEYGNVEYIKRNKNFLFIGEESEGIVGEIEKLLNEEIAPSTAHIENAKAMLAYMYSN